MISIVYMQVSRKTNLSSAYTGERRSVYRENGNQVAREMYLVFGTYISFRVLFPANVTCYKFCMLDKARKRRVRVFFAKKRISPRSLSFDVFSISLLPSLSLSCIFSILSFFRRNRISVSFY